MGGEGHGHQPKSGEGERKKKGKGKIKGLKAELGFIGKAKQCFIT